MPAAFSDRFSDATRQLAAAATRANRLALENAESVFGVQLKVMERNLTATGGWLGELARGEDAAGTLSGVHSCGRTTCSDWDRHSRTWSVSACRPARLVRTGAGLQRINGGREQPLTRRNAHCVGPSPRNPDPADPSLCRVFLLAFGFRSASSSDVSAN